MRDPGNRMHNLAERALALSNRDPAWAIRMLCEWTGLSFELAFEVIEDVAAIDTDKSAQATE
jgi:hypothetical protein